MLSLVAEAMIDASSLEIAARQKAKADRAEYVRRGFMQFDWFAQMLNHIFEQLGINFRLTRNSLIPVQDQKITSDVYVPVLTALSDPKWKVVNDDLAAMFTDFRDGDYAEVITKGHSALQRFLQVLVGQGKNGKGELAKLFAEAKSAGLVPVNRFTEPLIGVIAGYVPSERATKSTAKPSLSEADAPDALLFMNVVMVFVQFCLQRA